MTPITQAAMVPITPELSLSTGAGANFLGGVLTRIMDETQRTK